MFGKDAFLTEPMLTVEERVRKSLTSADKREVMRAMDDLVEVNGVVMLARDVDGFVEKIRQDAVVRSYRGALPYVAKDVTPDILKDFDLEDL